MAKVKVCGIDPDSKTADLISIGLVLAGPVGWLGLLLLNKQQEVNELEAKLK